MTRDQLGTCIRLQDEGLVSLELRLPLEVDYSQMPIPGLQLFTNTGQTKLMMVQPDGSTVDLLEVHRLAEDLVRNWHEGMPASIPGFVGDFGRLATLAKALNGTPAPKEDGT